MANITMLSVWFLSRFLTYHVGQRLWLVGQREKPVLGHVLHFNPQVRPGRNYFFVYTYNSQNMSDPKIQSELL